MVWLYRRKLRKKFLFPDIGRILKIKLGSMLEKLTQRHNRREQASLDDCDIRRLAYTQFLQIEKNQQIDLQEHLKGFCNALAVFGFNNAKHDLYLIKSYLLPLPDNERDIEPTFIKETNQFVLFKFGDLQLLDILIFNVRAINLESFMEAYKTSEKNDSSPAIGLITLTQNRRKNIPHLTPS